MRDRLGRPRRVLGVRAINDPVERSMARDQFNLSYEPTATGGVRVRTDRDEYEADTLVITAGAWDANLMPHLRGIAGALKQVVERECVAHHGGFHALSPDCACAL